jgi:L-threonylcarbamoyladenylate synthase
LIARLRELHFQRDNLTVKTVITDDPEEAAKFIRSSGIVAFPTETVYGLGANIFDKAAIAKIFEAKRRPADNPLIVHICEIAQIKSLASSISDDARKLIGRFFPGPLTVVLQKSEDVPILATAGLETVGVRMPRNQMARDFLAACETPVAAPSANLSGRPSPTTWESVAEDLDGRIDCILRGDPTKIGLESTVVDCSGNVPLLLRPGAVSIEELRAVVPEIRRAADMDVEKRHSPGMHHQHYSPEAKVRLVSGGDTIEATDVSAYIGIKNRIEKFEIKMLCTSVESYASKLFEFFRECDRAGIDTIYCETVSDEGIGMALMDRLRRASERS